MHKFHWNVKRNAFIFVIAYKVLLTAALDICRLRWFNFLVGNCLLQIQKSSCAIYVCTFGDVDANGKSGANSTFFSFKVRYDGINWKLNITVVCHQRLDTIIHKIRTTSETLEICRIIRRHTQVNVWYVCTTYHTRKEIKRTTLHSQCSSSYMEYFAHI